MTDENTEAVEEEQEESPVDSEAEETTTDDDSDEFDAEKAREKIRKINSENRNLRKRAAEAEAKAKGADENGQKLTALEAENLRLRIAVKHGLPERLVKRLTGTTEEEILQDAEELMELIGGKKPPAQQPKEKLRSVNGQSRDAEIDVDAVVDRVFTN